MKKENQRKVIKGRLIPVKVKKKIFVCHYKTKLTPRDIRENFPIWRNVKNLFEQFKDNTKNLKFSDKKDARLLTLYEFYFGKIVEHYDVQFSEIAIFSLCSIVESIGKRKFGRRHGNKKRYLMAIEEYFNPEYTSDPNFMRDVKKLYAKERTPFTHEARQTSLITQIASGAQIGTFVQDQNGIYILGAKSLFHIAVEVVTNYFEEISIP